MENHKSDSKNFDKLDNDWRFNRIERQLKLLTRLGLIQMVILGLLLFSSFLPNLFTYLQFLMVLGLLIGLTYFFRNQIPGWFGDASRLLFSFFENDRDQGTGKP